VRKRKCLKKAKTWTHELQASLKPFSIAGIKFEGIACPIIMLSNSNLPPEPDGRGSTYLHIVSCQFVITLQKELNKICNIAIWTKALRKILHEVRYLLAL